MDTLRAPVRDSETQPLLQDTEHNNDQARNDDQTAPKRQIGVITAVFLVFNRVIGTGVFATPSAILGFSGSVGLALVMWVLGALFAVCGMQVYIIWGTALPRNGGEKNYIEHLFPKPPRLISSIYAGSVVLLAHGAGNVLMFAEYSLASLAYVHPSPSRSFLSPVRIVSFLCLTSVALLHGLHIPSGIRLQNALGFLKFGILSIVLVAGLIALCGHLQEGVQRPGNFDSWETIWEGSRTDGSVISASLYNVIYSFIGYNNANYALSEMKDPAGTLRIAGPLAICTIGLFYVLCNIAYFAAASKEEISGSGRLVAALLFRNVWGAKTERMLNAFVALSALGTVSFSFGRVNQELGKKQVLPFSKVWASDWPARAPLAGFALHAVICLFVIFMIPEGDAFNFVINMVYYLLVPSPQFSAKVACYFKNSYPPAVINATISIGLLYLSLRNHPFFARGERSLLLPRPSSSIASTTCFASYDAAPTHAQHTPDDTTAPTQTEYLTFAPSLSLIIPTAIFAVSNVFLLVMPLTKPPPGVEPYKRLPYWTHAAGGWAIFALGGLWWVYRERKMRKVRDSLAT
ncbi:hypothetical protein D9619_005089 [Psilocybe cf. subviscida]|uniref:High-affinity methionine permease n=1 Tax=Psilocybe cf. subviscida TaxID=2480587 RepID=A0A8H5BQ76_9AGAR|nr:hypothetical protein D9619_005089 [Psilocybe cf. subviscida]